MNIVIGDLGDSAQLTMNKILAREYNVLKKRLYINGERIKISELVVDDTGILLKVYPRDVKQFGAVATSLSVLDVMDITSNDIFISVAPSEFYKILRLAYCAAQRQYYIFSKRQFYKLGVSEAQILSTDKQFNGI